MCWEAIVGIPVGIVMVSPSASSSSSHPNRRGGGALPRRPMGHNPVMVVPSSEGTPRVCCVVANS